MRVFIASSQSLVHRQHRIADTSPDLLMGVLKGFVLFGMFARPEAARIQARSSGIALAAIRIAAGD
jgi:hypothetical protein